MRFREVAIHSAAPLEAVRFYRDGLGLPTDGDAVQAGRTRLRFVGGAPPAPYHLAFNVPANQIRAARAWVKERAPMLSDDIFDFDAWQAEAVYFEDVEGNVLELIARRTLQNDVDGAFTPDMLLEVSEVGLPVADPPAAVGTLERDLGIPVYSGDRVTFSAVGDEHGLFIVVPPGRTWLPTDRRATEAPARIVVDSPRQGVVTIGSVEIASPGPCASP